MGRKLSEWSNYILNYRKKNNMTQKQLSEKIKVSELSISDWEHDRKSPNPSVEKRVREFLNSGL